MESFSKSFICFAAVFLTACGVSAGVRGKRPYPQNESILDLINTEQVEKVIAARRQHEMTNTPPNYYQRNELGEGSAETMIVTMPEDDDNYEIPRGAAFRNMLKSSKSALNITRKEYLKEDWCKTETFIQKIREPGCLSATVVNNFCYGQCNSFYIPKGPRRREGNDERPPPAFRSCSFCKPKKFTWISVTLHCPRQNTPFRRKRLQKVKQCKCLPVNVN